MLYERLSVRPALLAAVAARAGASAVLISVLPGAPAVDDFVRQVALSVGRGCAIVVGGVGARRVDPATIAVGNPLLVVHGPGERAVAAIVAGLRAAGRLHTDGLAAIANLIFSVDGVVARTREEFSVAPLHLVPSAEGLSQALARRDVVSLSTSVGCNGHCTFCSVKCVTCSWSWHPRERAVLAQWLRKIVAAGARPGMVVNIVDDAMATTVEHLEMVTDVVAATNATTGASLKFRCSTRVDHVVNPKDTAEARARRRAAWEAAARAGLTAVFLGIESGSSSQLRRLGKRTDSGMNRDAIRELRRLGVAIETGFIPLDPFLPTTWRDEMRDNVEIARLADVATSCPTWLSALRVYEDTPVARQLAQRGLLRGCVNGEMSYEYFNPEVRAFVADLGPAQCKEGSPLRDAKRLAKIAQRYGGQSTRIKELVAELINRELDFVSGLMEAKSRKEVGRAQRQYKAAALALLRGAARLVAYGGGSGAVAETGARSRKCGSGSPRKRAARARTQRRLYVTMSGAEPVGRDGVGAY